MPLKHDFLAFFKADTLQIAMQVHDSVYDSVAVFS